MTPGSESTVDFVFFCRRELSLKSVCLNRGKMSGNSRRAAKLNRHPRRKTCRVLIDYLCEKSPNVCEEFLQNQRGAYQSHLVSSKPLSTKTFQSTFKWTKWNISCWISTSLINENQEEDCALHRAPASSPWNWTWQSISSSCLQYNWKCATQMFALLSCSIICVCAHQTARSPRCRTLAANAAAPRLYLCLFIASAFHWTRHSPETFLISPRSPPPPPPPPPSSLYIHERHPFSQQSTRTEKV